MKTWEPNNNSNKAVIIPAKQNPKLPSKNAGYASFQSMPHKRGRFYIQKESPPHAIQKSQTNPPKPSPGLIYRNPITHTGNSACASAPTAYPAAGPAAVAGRPAHNRGPARGPCPQCPAAAAERARTQGQAS